jgi:glycosyltransferase involved in cell wall biosynthesis
MNILMMGRWLPPPRQTVKATREFQFARHLARSHRLTVAFVTDTSDVAGTVSALRNEFGDLEFATVPRGWNSLASAVRLAAGESCTLSYFRSEALRTRLADRMRNTRYDLVFVLSSTMIQYALDTDPAIPMVVDFGALDSEWWARQAARGTFGAARFFRTEAARLRAVETVAARRAVRCVVEMPETAKIVAALAPGAVTTVIPNGVDMVDPGRALRVGRVPTVVLSVALSGDEKLDEAINFCRAIDPAVRAHVPDVRFVIASRQPISNGLPAKGHPVVELVGPGMDLRLLFHDWTVAVAPPLPGLDLRSGVLEPMAAGIPVVTFSSVCDRLCPEAVLKVGVPDRPAEFVAHIVELLKNGALRQEIGERGRQFVESNFSWGILAARLESVLSGVKGVSEVRGAGNGLRPIGTVLGG